MLEYTNKCTSNSPLKRGTTQRKPNRPTDRPTATPQKQLPSPFYPTVFTFQEKLHHTTKKIPKTLDKRVSDFVLLPLSSGRKKSQITHTKNTQNTMARSVTHSVIPYINPRDKEAAPKPMKHPPGPLYRAVKHSPLERGLGGVLEYTQECRSECSSHTLNPSQ